MKIIKFINRKIKKYNADKKFRNEFVVFKELSSENQRFNLDWRDRKPCLNDKTDTTGFDSHCIYHPAWAARVLARTNPKIHIDISSALEFVSVVSAFIPIKFYDYRPAKIYLNNLTSEKINVSSLPFDDASIESLSCMHVIEHIGLGRYDDALNPDGDLDAINELKRVVAPNGNLLFVTPVGKPKIMFNAHRIYSYGQIIDYFKDFTLVEFALVPDSRKDVGLIYGASPEIVDAQKYGCGCFWFVKNQ